MNTEVITKEQIKSRCFWVDKIRRLSDNFSENANKIEDDISKEIRDKGIDSLLGHLRLCGVIPEYYKTDSSEEKLYSKYTDIVIHEAYKSIGFNSLVLKDRANVADVECVNDNYGFVADAKAFRLSRTAKNQKDFKVQAMDGWKHGKPYAMVVCPVYQLPTNSSQIYQQAGERSVCVGTYTHLAVFSRYANASNPTNAMELLHQIFKTVESMNPSKDANLYWQAINRTILDFDKKIAAIWKEEKQASVESIQVSRDEALGFLASERERIMRLTKDQAIKEVLRARKLEHKIEVIQSVNDCSFLGLL